jgi:uncharacterized membrane protein
MTQNLTSLSCRTSPWMILLIFVTGTFFSALIPSFQSPDESAHIMRAYLLSKGTIILDAPTGNASGGMIDSGLIAYIAAYDVLPFKPDRKLSNEEMDLARTFKWTGAKEFHPAPGTGYYFPIIYMPQAIGLALGEKSGLSIDTSYQLARFMAIASIAAILFAAFNLYNVNPLIIALLIIPMSLFQFASASLDGIATALAIFSVAAFLRLADEKMNDNPWLFYALTFSVGLLATSRVHLLPLFALVFAACFYIKNKRYFLVSAFTLLLVIAWTAIAIKTTVDTRVVVGASKAAVVVYYIRNPLAFIDVLIATILNSQLVGFYCESFFGILGWLDARFSEGMYKFFYICTFLISLLSVSVKNLKVDWVPRTIILTSALASILLIFFALLVTWNPHPATLIQGVQGRYFLVPMIMIAYAVSGGLKLHDGMLRKIALLLVFMLGLGTIFSTTRLLIERYYLVLEKPSKF